MTRSVADAALILTVIAGKDSLDNYTSTQPPTVPDYTKALKSRGLKGARLGVPRQFVSSDETILAAFNASLDVMRGLGATVVDSVDYPAFGLDAGKNETVVLTTDFKARPKRLQLVNIDLNVSQVDLNRYLAELVHVPSGVKNLAGLIAYNSAHADKELLEPYWTDQSRSAHTVSRIASID